VHNVPLATNPATAELCVAAFATARDDLRFAALQR
jgi:methylglyoxal synthase